MNSERTSSGSLVPPGGMRAESEGLDLAADGSAGTAIWELGAICDEGSSMRGLWHEATPAPLLMVLLTVFSGLVSIQKSLE